ncbi:DUF4885 family protein [Ruminiclostridium herbifermentans]|uniref:DUF4885 family protein n=1 Tax=Ruminiclostridium herbifermentans TaxID=2488810 RepID=A0A4U7J8B8_9FIRM|nr:DUF4885 family protein [Ruminiclostridium herbifermentans]QNU68126.1 DUF4885 family protein [Ruminiclostridium herbifermentans]
MGINTTYTNYYNIKGIYTTETPQTPAWKKKYEVTTDEIKSKNYSQNSDVYKAYCKLEEIYYSASVSNRSKYKSVDELSNALGQKYLFSSTYKDYSYSQRRAMYENELEMTLYGCLSGGGNLNDPHLSGAVSEPSESDMKSYNRQMVNLQFQNILSKFGISLAPSDNLYLTIDPFEYQLKVLGIEDEELIRQLEEALNNGDNSRQLFFHILHNCSTNISDNVRTKYRALKDFQNVTGLDLRNFIQVDNKFINKEGINALDIYKESLKTTKAVPNEFKGSAYLYFNSLLQKLSKVNFSEIPDLNLSIGYKNGVLYDISNENVQIETFNVSV